MLGASNGVYLLFSEKSAVAVWGTFLEFDEANVPVVFLKNDVVVLLNLDISCYLVLLSCPFYDYGTNLGVIGFYLRITCFLFAVVP